MPTREPLMDKTYFDEIIDFRRTSREKQEHDIKTPERYPKIEIIYYSLFLHQYQLVISMYSRGDAIADLKSEYLKIISYWELYLNHANHQNWLIEKSRENYVASIWIFSFGIFLKVDKAIMRQVLKCINGDGKDALFDLVVSKSGFNQNKTPSDKLLYPKIYTPLYDAILIEKDEASSCVKKFLKTWYSKMKGAYWYDNHKYKNRGGFFGYWCFEAALVTYLYDLDDSSYREMAYYPKDIVEYARKN